MEVKISSSQQTSIPQTLAQLKIFNEICKQVALAAILFDCFCHTKHL